MNSMDSAFLGAIVGGLFSFLGSWVGTCIMVKHMKGEQILREESQRRAAIKDLRAELEFNLLLSTPGTEASYPKEKYKFSTSLWDQHQGKLYFVDERIRENLIQTYCQMKVANEMVDYSRSLGNHQESYNPVGGRWQGMVRDIHLAMQQIVKSMEVLSVIK